MLVVGLSKNLFSLTSLFLARKIALADKVLTKLRIIVNGTLYHLGKQLILTGHLRGILCQSKLLVRLKALSTTLMCSLVHRGTSQAGQKLGWDLQLIKLRSLAELVRNDSGLI